MKPEQRVGIIFSVFGVAMGLLSNFIGVLLLAFVIPIAGYVGMVFAISKMDKTKNLKWILTKSVMSFVLLWMVVWIFVYNMG